MGNMTLAIPDVLQRKMSLHSDVRWSAVARCALERKVSELELLDKLLSRSKLTEDDAEKIGSEIKMQIRRKFDKRFA